MVLNMDRLVPELKLPNEKTFLDYAVENLKKSGKLELRYVDPRQRTILLTGNISCGKTTMIQKIQGTTQEKTKSTFLMDYHPLGYLQERPDGRKCDVWELGGGVLYRESLNFLMNNPQISCILCLDLSQPQFLFHTQDVMIKLMLGFAKKQRDYKNQFEMRTSQIPSDHSDKLNLKPFPLPFIIVGCKYDLFHKFEPEIKRIISQFMRYLAHIYCAHLFFWSDRNSEILKQVKEIISHYTYGTIQSTAKKTDYNRALVIPPFTDSFNEIDPSYSGPYTIDRYRNILETHFKQVNPHEEKNTKNPADDPEFSEPIIDAARAKLLSEAPFAKLLTDHDISFYKAAEIETLSKSFEEVFPFAESSSTDESQPNKEFLKKFA